MSMGRELTSPRVWFQWVRNYLSKSVPVFRDWPWFCFYCRFTPYGEYPLSIMLRALPTLSTSHISGECLLRLRYLYLSCFLMPSNMARCFYCADYFNGLGFIIININNIIDLSWQPSLDWRLLPPAASWSRAPDARCRAPPSYIPSSL